MAVSSEGKTAAAGLAGAVLGILGLLFVVSGLMLGPRPGDKDAIAIDASRGDHR